MDIWSDPDSSAPSGADLSLPTIELDRPGNSSVRPEPDENLDAVRGNPLPELGGRLHPFLSVTEPSDCLDHGDQMLAEKMLHDGSTASRESYNSTSDVPLELQLLGALQKHAHPRTKAFLPMMRLVQIVRKDVVLKELSRCPRLRNRSQDMEQIADEVCRECSPQDLREGKSSLRRIFAILVLMYQVESIEDFLAENITDADLPLSKEQGSYPGTVDLRRTADRQTPLSCFRNWRQNDMVQFYEWQWSVRVPFFSKGSRGSVKHYVLQEDAILPWTFDSRHCAEVKEYGGGYGEVWRVQIHPEHHDFQESYVSSSGFAVKRLRSPSRVEFKKEMDMLKKFSGNNSHPHLISLLATFEQGSQCFLLFPWAEYDLLSFWDERMPEPLMNRRLALWVAEQCFGIASGLQTIHNYNPYGENLLSANTAEKTHGRHGDIKPENILLFCNPEAAGADLGVLQIADFGLTVFNSRYSSSGIPNEGIRRTPTYRPPECDIVGGTIGRSWDIWTLGCLYLEFVTWLLGGNELLRQFGDERVSQEIWGDNWESDIFFEIVRPQGTQATAAMVKPQVVNWIRGLHANPCCTQHLHDFLDFIATKMLIVESSEPVEKRATAREVLQKLEEMHKNCRRNEAYGLNKVPFPSGGEGGQAGDTDAVIVYLNEGAQKALMHAKKPLRIHMGRTRKSTAGLKPPPVR